MRGESLWLQERHAACCVLSPLAGAAHCLLILRARKWHVQPRMFAIPCPVTTPSHPRTPCLVCDHKQPGRTARVQMQCGHVRCLRAHSACIQALLFWAPDLCLYSRCTPCLSPSKHTLSSAPSGPSHLPRCHPPGAPPGPSGLSWRGRSAWSRSPGAGSPLLPIPLCNNTLPHLTASLICCQADQFWL